MLDDYKETQVNVYNIMVNELKNNNISHAYLVDENFNSEAFNIVLAFVKSILCKEKYTSYGKCNNCNLCEKIDNNNYPELNIIEPDGNIIKKQQILDLQKNFSRSAIEGKKRIYIIKDADRMKAETANSMLKFLEEPDNSIVAILMTNNYNNVLPTIVSRCQVIKLNAGNSRIDNEEYETIALKFIESIENNWINALIDVKMLWFDKIPSKNRDAMLMVFDIMIDYYYDILKIKIGNNDIKYSNYYDSLKKISEMNKEKSILNKIKYLLEAKDSIKFNVNSNILVDSLIVNVGGKYESSWD